MRPLFDEFAGEERGIPDAWDLLSPRLGESRRQRIESVAAQRTAYLRLCLQDVHDPHNLGACLRSAEACGLQYVDCVNLHQKFAKLSSTAARGANRWLDVSRFRNFDAYIAGLRARGYKIAAAFPAQSSNFQLETLPIDQPLAIILGNENAGLDEAWSPHIDYRFTIPMYGMTESYNVSVSAALILYNLASRCRASVPRESLQLSDLAQKAALNRWMARHSRSLEKELMILRRSANNGALEL